MRRTMGFSPIEHRFRKCFKRNDPDLETNPKKEILASLRSVDVLNISFSNGFHW